MTIPTLRIARPTDDLAALLRSYGDGLGLRLLSSFTNHNGFNGVMLGHPQAPYHLEFTHQPGHVVGRAPTDDHQLVWYLPKLADWHAVVQRLQAAGFAPVPSYNPYWDELGRTSRTPTATGWCCSARRGTCSGSYFSTTPTLRPAVQNEPE